MVESIKVHREVSGREGAGGNWWGHHTPDMSREEQQSVPGATVQTPAAGSCQHFISHREIGVTAGFAGTNDLMVKSPLMVSRLSILGHVGVHGTARTVPVWW